MPKADAYYRYLTPYGPITIASDGDAITFLRIGETSLSLPFRPSTLTNRASTELLEYFAGKRKAFDVPIRFNGTSFQKQVWNYLLTIPYGQTRTSAQIAEALNHPKSYRSVGSAVKDNPIEVIIPSHRVVTAQGKPTGTGQVAHIRQGLLNLEASSPQ